MSRSALIVIYRVLRDSLCDNISFVTYDEKREEINFILKGSFTPYGKQDDTDIVFENVSVSIGRDGLRLIGAEDSAPDNGGFLRKIFGGRNGRH